MVRFASDVEHRDEHLSRRCDDLNLVVLLLFQPRVERPEVLLTPHRNPRRLHQGPAQRACLLSISQYRSYTAFQALIGSIWLWHCRGNSPLSYWNLQY